MNKRLLLLSLISVFVVGSMSAMEKSPQLAMTYIQKAGSAYKNRDYTQLVADLETAAKWGQVSGLNIALNMARKLRDEAASMQPAEIESDLLVIKRSLAAAMAQLSK